MASAGLDFTNITPDNGAVRELSQLVFLQTIAPDVSQIGQLFDVRTGVHKGDKIVGIGEFNALGKKAGTACTPTYEATKINAIQKEWANGEWEVALSMCYKDTMATLDKYTQQMGKDVADLTSDDYVKIIVQPSLTEALNKAIIRMAFFGDTAAANVSGSGGGNITAGVVTSLFTMCDGVFKRLETLATSDASSNVAITANSEITYAEQKSAILASGIATGVFDSLIYNAKPELAQANDRVIIATRSLVDALERDLRVNNKGSELQWQSLFAGVDMTTYNGVNIVKMPILDQMIQQFNNTGTALVKPHRAIYTTKGNLLLGTGAKDAFQDFNIFYNEDERLTKFFSGSDIDTQIFDDKLIMSAF